jgi:hypothetical protein
MNLGISEEMFCQFFTNLSSTVVVLLGRGGRPIARPVPAPAPHNTTQHNDEDKSLLLGWDSNPQFGRNKPLI